MGKSLNCNSSNMLMVVCACFTTNSLGHMETGAQHRLTTLTGEDGDQTCDPLFTRQVVYPLHHSGSLLEVASGSKFKISI